MAVYHDQNVQRHKKQKINLNKPQKGLPPNGPNGQTPTVDHPSSRHRALRNFHVYQLGNWQFLNSKIQIGYGVFPPFLEEFPYYGFFKTPELNQHRSSWWFRNPANSPVEVGSWNPIIYRVLYIPGDCLGFLNHQQYDHIVRLCILGSWTSTTLYRYKYLVKSYCFTYLDFPEIREPISLPKSYLLVFFARETLRI